MDRYVTLDRQMREDGKTIEEQQATMARQQERINAIDALLSEKEGLLRFADERLDRIEALFPKNWRAQGGA